MAEKIKLNKTALAKLVAVDGNQTVYWDTEQPGFGVRVSNGRLVDGVREYGYSFFCQGRLLGKTAKITIGKSPTFSPDLARKKAREYLGKMAAGQDPRVEKGSANGSATFGDLMTGYVELLEMKGKKSARNVKNDITAGIEKKQPKIWKKRAATIDLDDCVKVVAKIKEAGKLRQADKIRSYIRSAFSEAIKARGNVNAPAKLRNMNIKANPARDMVKVEGANNARTRALSLSEFRAYWSHAKELPEPGRSIMMFHVLTGGQRIQQLSRVTLDDIDRDTQTITLLDYKGRRTEPRRHSIPLLPEALACIERLTGSGNYALSCDGGKSPINGKYIARRVDEIRDAMNAAKELEGGHFSPGTIRATIETRLAAKPYRQSSDVLGQLLSHGQGGVQARHYQHHTFHDEKLEALQMLQRMVEGRPEPIAQVIPIHSEVRA